MTSITIESNNKSLALECIVDGVDILADVMGGCGVEHDVNGRFYLPTEDDFDWWQRWAEREERICAAYAEADDETRIEYEDAVCDFGYDMEVLQDKLETVLGIIA